MFKISMFMSSFFKYNFIMQDKLKFYITMYSESIYSIILIFYYSLSLYFIYKKNSQAELYSKNENNPSQNFKDWFHPSTSSGIYIEDIITIFWKVK